MAQTSTEELSETAKKVLKQNDRGGWTMPANDLYPHQWLWDSCFIAIGLRHLDVERAQTELRNLLRGQWSNGMLPNIIFDSGKQHHRDRELWRSYISPYAPQSVATSGITQPPMLAEAVVQVGEKLKMPERRSWYKSMYPHLMRYHEWLYTERDPHHQGLVVLIHPYEAGLDNSPPWISELRKHNMPLWLSTLERIRLGGLISLVRRDTQHVTLNQRMDSIEAAAYWGAMLRLRRKAYNSEAILSRSLFALEDLSFNSLLVRANAHLKEIAVTIKKELPAELQVSVQQSENVLEQLWDENAGQYYSRSFVGHKLIEEPTIATLFPLYSGSISQERAERLVELLKSSKWFGAPWPLPSVPLNSSYFDPYKYWQGPTWINTNWLVINGLRRYGFDKEADELKERTIELVAKSGMYEYFNPLDGQPAGAANFSWTAALTIDLLKS